MNHQQRFFACGLRLLFRWIDENRNCDFHSKDLVLLALNWNNKRLYFKHLGVNTESKLTWAYTLFQSGWIDITRSNNTCCPFVWCCGLAVASPEFECTQRHVAKWHGPTACTEFQSSIPSAFTLWMLPFLRILTFAYLTCPELKRGKVITMFVPRSIQAKLE